MKSERELWLEKRLEEQAVLIETLEKRIKGLHVANDSFGDLARRVEEFQEHERQTHERLGAILGTDDSLEACAKRLRQRVEELERANQSLRGELRGADDEIKHQAKRAEAAGAENARLVMAEAEAMALVLNHEGAIARLTRERNEARATKDMHKERQEEAWVEVERLEGLILDWDGDGDSPSADAIYAETRRIRAQREEGKR